MSCPFMKIPTIASDVRAAIHGASEEQRAAAVPHAIDAAKAPSPGLRARAVVQWLRALGQEPMDWYPRIGRRA